MDRELVMDFSQVESITIPEGEVTKIQIGGTTVWEKIVYTGLKFTNVRSRSSSIEYQNHGTSSPNMKYSLDNGSTWINWSAGTAVSVAVGQTICVKGNNPNGFSTSVFDYTQISITGEMSSSGNLCSLLDDNDGSSVKTIPCAYCFYELFYNNFFSLTTAPELPAATLKEGCYGSMFEGCMGLTQAPALPATTLDESCYSWMFSNCQGLTQAPALPATTLISGCYQYMFEDCSNIKLSTTKTGIYQTAYRIPKQGTGTTATNALLNMFAGTGGTFTGTPSINTTYYMA